MDARHKRDARSVDESIQISLIVLWLVASTSSGLLGQSPGESTPPPDTSNSPAETPQYEFFESNIRPALHQHCLACHNEKKPNGGLALDSRAGWMKGGDSGPAIVPGKPDESLLIRTIRHGEPGLEMPAKAPKLDDPDIAKFSHWIEQGAFDPRETPEPMTSVGQRSDTDAQWESIAAQRAQCVGEGAAADRAGGPAGLGHLDGLKLRPRVPCIKASKCVLCEIRARGVRGRRFQNCVGRAGKAAKEAPRTRRLRVSGLLCLGGLDLRLQRRL